MRIHLSPQFARFMSNPANRDAFYKWVLDPVANKTPLNMDGLEIVTRDPVLEALCSKEEIIPGIGTITQWDNGEIYGYFGELAPIKYMVDITKPPLGPPLREEEEFFGFSRQTKKGKFYKRVYDQYMKAYKAKFDGRHTVV